jgi:hypothetical protein
VPRISASRIRTWAWRGSVGAGGSSSTGLARMICDCGDSSSTKKTVLSLGSFLPSGS